MNLPDDMQFVDTNNLPLAMNFIIDNNLGEFTEKFYMQGFCVYPLFKFFIDNFYEE